YPYDLGIGVVFVVPHVFGGKRLLGRELPEAPHRTRGDAVSEPPHWVQVTSAGTSFDGTAMRDLNELGTRLAAERDKIGPRMDVRFAMDVTFGEYARVVDIVAAA